MNTLSCATIGIGERAVSVSEEMRPVRPETVDTMPAETIRAFQAHGRVAETLTRGAGAAQRHLEELERVGVNYNAIVLTLETEGVQKFVDSFASLLEGVHAKGDALRATRG